MKVVQKRTFDKRRDMVELQKDHCISLKDGEFDIPSTSKSDLDHLFNILPTAPGHDKLVVHFHGGLVDKQSAMNNAMSLLDRYQNLNAYQLFFIWESSISDVLQNKLNEISKELIFQQLLLHIVPLVAAKVGTGEEQLKLPQGQNVLTALSRFAARQPIQHPAQEQLQETEKAKLRQGLQQDSVVQAETSSIAQTLLPKNARETQTVMPGLPIRGSTHSLISSAVLPLREGLDAAERQLATTTAIIEKSIPIVGSVLERFNHGRDHGLYATVVEEIVRQLYLAEVGEGIWDAIKQETLNAFHNDPQRYGGTAFLLGLKKYWEGGHRPRITLVGHSAGAVYICNVLQHADVYGLPADVKFDLVLLALACTFELFDKTTKQCKDRINAVRIFGMQDKIELDDQVVPAVPALYPHSLLYLVSGAFEEEADTPILGMQRFYPSKAPYNQKILLDALDYLVPPNDLVWSPTNDGPGLASNALHHGEFYSNDLTLQSLGQIIENGLIP